MARVIVVNGERRGRFPESNCFLIKAGGTTILVDAGCGPVWDAARKSDFVVYTHFHPDHISGYRSIPGRVRQLAPRVDAVYASLGLSGLARRYAPEAAGEWLSYVWRVFRLRGVPSAEPYHSWEPLRLGGTEITPIPARGHTWGHHMLLIDGSILILGDVDLTGFGPWYGHPESSIEAFLSDISLVREIEANTYYSSHLPEPLGREEALRRLDAYEARLHRSLEAVLRWMREREVCARPLDLAGSGLIYRRYLPGMEAVMRYFETVMIGKLLDWAVSRGLARRGRKGAYCART